MNVNELMYDLEECKLEVESVLWLYDLSNE